MKNHIVCLTFFIASSFWKFSKSENIESGRKNYENLDSEKQIRRDRGYHNTFEKYSYIGGIPISEYSAFNDEIGQQTGYNDDGKGLFVRNGYSLGFDDGNPDVHGDIRRPCQSYDSFCIRKFFAEHSKCKVSGRAVPDPLYRDEGTVYFASLNITETQVSANYGGLNNARVTEFYINKVTDQLVIAVTFDNASKYSNYTYFKYYLRGREPIVTGDFGGIQYGSLTVTVVIPQIHNLRLETSEIYTYGDNSRFFFALGPRIGASTDPEVTAMYASLYTDIPNEYLAEISNQGTYFVLNYIQYNICDFGIKAL